MSEIKAPNIETIKTLQDAWLKGALQFQRSITYLQQPAPLGFVFYLILYQEGERVVYQGAYKIKLTLADKLISEDKLIAYLCFELAKELE